MAIAEYDPLFDESGNRYRIVAARLQKGTVIARLAGIESRDQAERLNGVALYVPRSALPDTGQDEYYAADLVGVAAVGRDGIAIGRIAAVHDFGAGDLVEIAFADGGSEMFAFTRENFPEIDLDRRIAVFVKPVVAEAEPADEAKRGGHGF